MEKKLRYWKHIELKHWPDMRPSLVAWARKRGFNHNSYFWNDVSVQDLMQSVPQLAVSLVHLKTRCLYAAVIVSSVTPRSQPYYQNIHIDDMPGVETRLQIPIMNTEGSFTHFFSAPPEKIIRKNTANGHGFLWIAPEDAVPETKVCIDRPTLIRTGKPHSVECLPNFPGPRMALTLRLQGDPTKWLEDDSV